MRYYVGIIVLCWLFGGPALLLARDPAPQPRPVPDLDASAGVAERLLVKEYGEDAKGIKGAKIKLAFRVTGADPNRENVKIETLFAIAAEEISYSDDGLVTLKNARFVEHSPGSKSTGPEPALLRLQFAAPVRSLQDIHKAQLKRVERGTETETFKNAEVALVVK
jgi:hypothetical protein